MSKESPVAGVKTVVGLTLSGGGMRGIGHLGVIKAKSLLFSFQYASPSGRMVRYNRIRKALP